MIWLLTLLRWPLLLLIVVVTPLPVNPSKSLVVFFDGGVQLSRAAGGVVLASTSNISSLCLSSWNESDISIDSGHAFYFGAVNSSLAAEYLSVIEALHLIKSSLRSYDSLIEEVYLLGDSSNVITSLCNQQSRFQDPLISTYSCIAKGLLNSISESVSIRLCHIPRSRNYLANSLCDLCLEKKRPFLATYINNEAKKKDTWILSDKEVDESISNISTKLIILKIEPSKTLLAQLLYNNKQSSNDMRLRIHLPAANLTFYHDIMHPSVEIAIPCSHTSKCDKVVVEEEIQLSLCMDCSNNNISETVTINISASLSSPTVNHSGNNKGSVNNKVVDVLVATSGDSTLAVRVGASVVYPAYSILSMCDTSYKNDSSDIMLSSYTVRAISLLLLLFCNVCVYK